MDVYLVPMLCLFFAWLVQVRRNRSIDMTALTLIALTIILIAGLRWYADVDYPLYVEMYHDNPTLADFSPDAIAGLYGEPGFLFVTAVFKSLDTGFAILAFACVIPAMILKSVVLSRLSRHASLALCLYLCLHFLTNEFIQLRWAVATGFIALAFTCQYLEKYWAAVLCFAMALVFHYFSAVFWPIAFAIPFLKGHRKLYLLFLVSLVLGVALDNDRIAPFLVNDSSLYVLARVSRYAMSPASPLGAFSILKLVMYAAIYATCVRVRPAYPWLTDKLNVFLFKVSFLSICLTLVFTFQPVMHYRTTVIADLFSIVLVLNAMSVAFERRTRALAFAGLVLLFGAWYMLDLRNNIAGGRIYDYQTWVRS